MQSPKHTNSLFTGLKAGLNQVTHRARLSRLPHPSWAWLLVPVVAIVSFVAVSGTTAPSIPPIALSSEPLYATAGGDKPVLALALSVEYPTVGAQYVDPDNNGTSDDPTYSSDREYLGYYDAESCYTYDDAGSGAPTGKEADYKRFVRRGPAIALATPSLTQPTLTTRMCWNSTTSYTKDDGTTPATSSTVNDAFSGNFLNWASSSAIDMLRLSLTGGDRVIDTPTLTVLQRAVLPDGDPIAMGNSNNFPAKQLLQTGAAAAIASNTAPAAAFASGVPYFGAVPTAMVTGAGGANIFVANTLNRIYFGTSKSGNTASGFGSYTLGNGVAGTSSSQIDPAGVTNFTNALPNNTTECATEGGICVLPTGTIKRIYYGAGTTWKLVHATGSINCTNAVFGDPIVGTQKKCYYRNAAGSNSWVPTTSPGTPGLNSDGFFFSRVQVCDRDPTTYVLKDVRDYNLCQKYSDGATTNPQASYKPAGAIQKYSDRLRLAAFGYLLDQTASYDSGGRYGGVLRAPIKYVGAKTFDVFGTENTATGGNPKQEWNPVTGVFYPNPDSNTTVACAAGTDCTATYLSGVVSYVNQFGRTGSVRGRYKKFDPIGELHYETLRYLQGLQPSADAVSGITTEMYDGFPAASSWPDDPYGGRSNTANYACLKSNIVVIGDKNTHDGSRLPSANTANNIPSINNWRTIVQNFEKNISTTTYVDGQGVTRTPVNPNGANNNVPNGATTSQILGSAYWAHTHDIRGTDWTGTGGPAKQRPGLRVKTFMFDVNEYGGSNNAATRRSSNQLFMAAKYGGFEADGSNSASAPYNTWGNPFKRDDGTVDKFVWEDTSTAPGRPGEANTYFLQSNARGVLSAFDDIFNRASDKNPNIASSAVESKDLTNLVGNNIFRGRFDTSDWSGDLQPFAVTVSSSTATPPNAATIATTPTWSASAQLNALVAPATSRNIVVGKRGATSDPVATNFIWADIEAALKTDLNKESPTSAADSLGSDRLAYLRGDKTKENNPFRKRTNLLGDIINSGVAYSGVPNASISSSTYTTFYNSNKARTAAVFVGANDGMLHAFNATSGTANSGKELFAYIPSWLGPKLSALTSPGYINAHQSYVDGTPTVGEAEVLNASSVLEWQTVLVSGTGNGGQGVFALDVTDPTNFSASKVKWEFTNSDDQDMGYVVGRPQILKMRTSAYGSTATYKWFAVVGSGANTYVNAVGGNFGSGKPSLFLLDLSKPVGQAWSEGTNYFKVSVPVNATLAATRATGIFNFVATLGTAAEVNYIYMGDLHGNLWKLDFSLLGTADWNINKLSPFKTGSGSSTVPYPLFIAKDASGNQQPITMAPITSFGPIPGSQNVLFGTGKFLETSDKTSTNQASFYMVYDNGSSTMDTLVGAAVRASAVSGRTRLKQGTSTAAVSGTPGTITVPAYTLGRAATDLNTETTRSGWYFDYATAGERQISNAKFVGDKVVFGSLIPAGASTGICSVAVGGGNTYTVNILTGSGKSVSSTVGLLGEVIIFDLTGLKSETISDSTGRRTRTLPKSAAQLGTLGSNIDNTENISTTMTVGRLSWRQINNYRELQ